MGKGKKYADQSSRQIPLKVRASRRPDQRIVTDTFNLSDSSFRLSLFPSLQSLKFDNPSAESLSEYKFPMFYLECMDGNKESKDICVKIRFNSLILGVDDRVFGTLNKLSQTVGKDEFCESKKLLNAKSDFDINFELLLLKHELVEEYREANFTILEWKFLKFDQYVLDLKSSLVSPLIEISTKHGSVYACLIVDRIGKDLVNLNFRVLESSSDAMIFFAFLAPFAEYKLGAVNASNYFFGWRIGLGKSQTMKSTYDFLSNLMMRYGNLKLRVEAFVVDDYVKVIWTDSTHTEVKFEWEIRDYDKLSSFYVGSQVVVEVRTSPMVSSPSILMDHADSTSHFKTKIVVDPHDRSCAVHVDTPDDTFYLAYDIRAGEFEEFESNSRCEKLQSGGHLTGRTSFEKRFYPCTLHVKCSLKILSKDQYNKVNNKIALNMEEQLENNYLELQNFSYTISNAYNTLYMEKYLNDRNFKDIEVQIGILYEDNKRLTEENRRLNERLAQVNDELRGQCEIESLKSENLRLVSLQEKLGCEVEALRAENLRLKLLLQKWSGGEEAMQEVNTMLQKVEIALNDLKGSIGKAANKEF